MLETLDEHLFSVINGLELGWFEPMFVAFRNKTTWIPLYVCIAAFSVWKLGIKWAGIFILSSVLCVVIGDQLSSEIVKKSIKRPRPCHQVSDVYSTVDLKVDCGSGYSFTSSHATNHMAVAVFWFLALAPYVSRWRWLLPCWALIIGICQVYVGVHYPGDILAGSLLGGMIGGLVFWLYNKIKSYIPSRH